MKWAAKELEDVFSVDLAGIDASNGDIAVYCFLTGLSISSAQHSTVGNWVYLPASSLDAGSAKEGLGKPREGESAAPGRAEVQPPCPVVWAGKHRQSSLAGTTALQAAGNVLGSFQMRCHHQ